MRPGEEDLAAESSTSPTDREDGNRCPQGASAEGKPMNGREGGGRNEKGGMKQSKCGKQRGADTSRLMNV